VRACACEVMRPPNDLPPAISAKPGSACRLVFSEADGLSGLVVDRYGDWLSVQLTSLALASRREMLSRLLNEKLTPAGIWLRTERGIRAAVGVPDRRARRAVLHASRRRRRSPRGRGDRRNRGQRRGRSGQPHCRRTLLERDLHAATLLCEGQELRILRAGLSRRRVRGKTEKIQ
jgi:hypothetical protein